MARPTGPAAQDVYRCTEAFAHFRDGLPLVYAAGDEVLADDVVLKTHGSFFELASARLSRNPAVEAATAGPGEKRTTAAPVPAPPAPPAA